jgi:hypothetical protein
MSSRPVPTNTAEYANKSRSELCRNCVRSPRNQPQPPTFTGSHQEAFCGGKSLNRLCEEMFRCCSMQLAGVVFQACSFNHSDISPSLESFASGRAPDYRTRRWRRRARVDRVSNQHLTSQRRPVAARIVSDRRILSDHLRRFSVAAGAAQRSPLAVQRSRQGRQVRPRHRHRSDDQDGQGKVTNTGPVRVNCRTERVTRD